MKKSLIFLIFLLGASIIFSGCSNQQKTSLNKDDASNNFERKRPDFGQPEEDPNLRGLVESISGNEISVLKIERPQFNSEELNSDENTKEKQEEKQTILNEGASGRMPGMGMGGGKFNKDGASPDADMQAQMMEKIKEMSSGKESVIIPIGIQMLKPDPEAKRGEMKMIEATLEDIETNSMLQIWLDENVSDRNVAKFVLISR
jgi:hypothetical protein